MKKEKMKKKKEMKKKEMKMFKLMKMILIIKNKQKKLQIKKIQKNKKKLT